MIQDDNNKKPKLEVEFKRESKTFTPEEILAMILNKMKETAESHFRNLRFEINKIVQTCDIAKLIPNCM